MAFVYPVPSLGSRMPKVSQGLKPGHQGVDIMYKRLPNDPEGLPTSSAGHYMPNGVPALAFGPGTVTTSKQIGTGGYVVLQHAKGLQSQYMHLSNRSVKVGDCVDGGDIIGTIFHNPEGYKLNHLHFQLRQNGSLVDPEPVIKNLPVLAPPGIGLLKMVLVVFVGWGIFKLVQSR